MKPRARRRPAARQARHKAHADPRARERAIDALALMRKGRSLRAAATEAHTTPDTVRQYLPRAIDRTARGRFIAKAIDGYEREMYMLTERGKIRITVRGSRAASRIAEHAAAVDFFLKTGKTTRLRPFRGQSIRAGKIALPFITNPNTLRRLGYAGELSYESLYALRS